MAQPLDDGNHPTLNILHRRFNKTVHDSVSLASLETTF